MGKDIHYHSLARDILTILSHGALLFSVLAAPNLARAFKPLFSGVRYDRQRWERRRIREALDRLRERRYVRFKQQSDDTYIIITERGRERLRKFEFAAVTLPEKPSRWDKRWQMVVFDIPEEKQLARKIFRDKLDRLGLLGLQRSVFIYPYPCEDEIDFLCQFLRISPYVHYIEANSLGSAEGKARAYFNLP